MAQMAAVIPRAIFHSSTSAAPPNQATILESQMIHWIQQLPGQILKAVKKGGRVVCGGIHMSDIPSFPYRLLWEERQVISVANLTRADAEEFLAVAPQAGVRTAVSCYPLEQANEALDDLRGGRLQGAAVLCPG